MVKDQNRSNQDEPKDKIIYFQLDSTYIDTDIVKLIGIQKGIRSIIVSVDQYKTSASINLDDFNEKTIKPLRANLSALLGVNYSKDEIQKIIGSIVTCIHNNIDLITQWGTQKKPANNDNEDILLSLVTAKENTDLLFKNQYGEHYAAIRIHKTKVECGTDGDNTKDKDENHLEIIPLNSSKFKHFLTRLFKKETDGKLPGKEAINNVINALAADAEYEGQVIPLHLRVAWGKPENRARENCIYYDMIDKDWRAVEISKDGWKIIKNDSNSPILFRRHNQIEQVEPARDYEPDVFDKFLDLTNVKKQYRQLIKVYIISAFVPDIAHVILNIHGPHGSAKSFLLRLIKMLIDPARPPLLTMSKNLQEFIQQVYHNYLAFYDNVKYISQERSDEICKAVTGIGSTKRKLYTDSEDVIYEYKHCLSINGINVALIESDALDRALMIELTEIDDENRRKEEDILAEFERIKPKLLAYIFDILAKTMQIKQRVHLPKLKRMADFTEWGEAISRAMAYDDMSFVNAFHENRSKQNMIAVEESLVGSLLVIFWNDYKKEQNKESQNEKPKFDGSPAELYSQLVDSAQSNDININNRQFPKTPAALVKKLNIIKPNLKEALNIVVEVKRDENNNSVITVYESVIHTVSDPA